MKDITLNKILWILVVACMMLPISSQPVFSAPKKAKVRMSIQYKKIMNDHSYMEIHAKAKGKHGYHPVADLNLKIYQVFGDSTTLLVEVKTKKDGSARYNFAQMVRMPDDSTGYYSYKIMSSGTDEYRPAKKSISVYDIDISGSVVNKDSINYVLAKASDPRTGNPVAGVPLQVQIERTLAYLNVDKDDYTTDENGAVLVPIANDIPGKDGIITFRVAINDSDDYGTVETSFDAPVGVPFVATDTFDQRTMWSPPSKTPLYLLIGPNLIIFGIWLTLFVLMFNLYKISKSN